MALQLDRVPGVYVGYNITSDVSGLSPNNRCLLIGLQLPGGIATPNVPYLAQSKSQVDVNNGGASSHASRLYRAARAQSQGAEIWILPVPDPGGTASTRLLTFTASPVWSSPNWILGTNTSASQASQCYLDVGGQQTSFQIAQGDTFNAIATNAQAALALITDLVATPTVGTNTVTLTHKHKAALGEDLPLRVWFSNPSCGVSVSCGTVTLATNATGGQPISITDGIVTAAFTPTAADTPAIDGSLFATAITNANMPVLAAVASPATGVVTLFHRPDRWVRRFTLTDGDATMTATPAWGTTGSGTPSLTAAMAYNTGDQAYKCWCEPFSDATSLGAVASQVITQDAIPVEKGQFVVTAISLALPQTALPGATTPALTTSELFTILHFQGSPVPAGEIAARVAAEIAATNDWGRNYNGLILQSTVDMPLAVPNKADGSTRSQWNSAIAAGYAPVAADSANRAVVRDSVTTFAAGNNPILLKSTKWSGALLPIYMRADLRQVLADNFAQPGAGKSIKAKGTPHTPRGVTVNGVRSVVLNQIKVWDQLDYFDYGSDIDSAVQPEISVSPTQIVVSVPFRTVADLDTVGIDAYPA